MKINNQHSWEGDMMLKTVLVNSVTHYWWCIIMFLPDMVSVTSMTPNYFTAEPYYDWEVCFFFFLFFLSFICFLRQEEPRSQNHCDFGNQLIIIACFI